MREAGGAVTLAHTVASARETVAAKTFDLVLLDNHLPDGKGYDLFEIISRRNPDAPIVMITGVPDLAEAVSLTRNGLLEYVTKSVSADALMELQQVIETPHNSFVFGGRFAHRHAEIRAGILNLADTDCRLNPLNLAAELPRGRTFITSLRLNF